MCSLVLIEAANISQVSGMDLINEVVHGDKWHNLPVIGTAGTASPPLGGSVFT